MPIHATAYQLAADGSLEPSAFDVALQRGIVSRLATAPSATNGDMHILTGVGGVWSGQAVNDLALYSGGAWTYKTPGTGDAGLSVYDQDTTVTWTWSGSAWKLVGEQILKQVTSAPTNTATAAGTAIDTFSLKGGLLSGRTITVEMWAENGSANNITARLIYNADVIGSTVAFNGDQGRWIWKLIGTGDATQTGMHIETDNAPSIVFDTTPTEDSTGDLNLITQLWAASGGTNTAHFYQISISETP